MSIANYVWAVARGLRTQVRPGTQSGVPMDALDNSIRILTAVANALEPHAPAAIPFVPGLSPDAPVATDRLKGPAENPGAYPDSASAIAEGARRILTGSTEFAASLIAWEKALLDAAVARMDEVERASGDSAADKGLEIDRTALQAAMRKLTGAPDLMVESFRMIVGGRSRQTALFSISPTPGLPRDLVVQRALPGLSIPSVFSGEVVQYEMLEVLHAAGMKVPKPLLLDTGSEALGASFLVVERAPGSPAQADYWLPVEQESIALDLARQMAALHALPTGTLGPKLPQSRARYDRDGWLEELNMFASAWETESLWPSVTMSAAIAWMRQNVDCLQDSRTLVHNDMVFHNVLAEDGAITAVLDWEQASVGHPGEDLGYCYPVVCMATDWEKFMAAYAEAGGPAISQREIDYFALRAGLRLMIMVLRGGRDAFQSGTATDVLVASAGAHFTQRLLHRVAGVLQTVLARS